VPGARVAFGVLAALALVLPAAAMNGSFEAAATRIQVRLLDQISSQDANAGDIFHFDTTSSVMIAGRFFPAETHGHGVVVAARSGRGPQPGSLVLAARSLDPADGEPVEVGLEPGQLSRTLEHDARGFTVPVGTEPVYVGTPRITNIAYEKGTLFYVDAPPPPSPLPLPGGTGS
jgi:hypothetical protein